MSPRILPVQRKSAPRMRAMAVMLLLLFGLLGGLILTSRLNPSPITGSAANASMATRVNISNGTVFSCNVTIPAGTSLMSFPCLGVADSRDVFLQNLSASGANVLAMYSYIPVNPGRWLVYNSSLPNYTVQSLGALDRNDGIYFVMAANETLIYHGFLPLPVSIAIRSGWNLVGYPLNITRNITQAIQSINTSLTLIRTLEGTLQTGSHYEYSIPGGGNLTNTSIYHGYWINASVADTWVLS